MSILGGLFKIITGTVDMAQGGIKSEGSLRICPKCGSPHNGICTHCATTRGANLIQSGVDDIKAADEQVYIEAEKRGYVLASKEYGARFFDIQSAYKDAKQKFEYFISENDLHAEVLISKHEQLVAIRKALEAEAEKTAKIVAEKGGVSTDMVKNALSGNTFAPGGGEDLFSLLHRYKEKKTREAECKGYNRAKAEYEKKIRALQREFMELQNISNQKIEEFHCLITDVLAAISNEYMKIATMKIME